MPLRSLAQPQGLEHDSVVPIRGITRIGAPQIAGREHIDVVLSGDADEGVRGNERELMQFAIERALISNRFR